MGATKIWLFEELGSLIFCIKMESYSIEIGKYNIVSCQDNLGVVLSRSIDELNKNTFGL